MGHLFSMFVIRPILAVYSSFVFTKLWAWYIVPAFSVDPIGMLTAFGIAIMASFLTHQHNTNTDNNEDSWERAFRVAFVSLFLTTWFFLLGGVAHAIFS